MSMSSTGNRIVYSSDITIEDPQELAALCVFYDAVVLPHVVEPNVDSISFDVSDTHQTFDTLKKLSEGHFGIGGIATWSGSAGTWDAEHHVLFEQAVVVRLGAPPSDVERWEEDIFFDMDAEEQLRTLTRMKNWELDELDGGAMLSIRPDLVRHLCRNDLSTPELHVSSQQPASREIMKFLEATSVLSYFVPKLGKLRVEQILQVRDKVEATRAGFSLHLQTLSKDVEQRIRGGESVEEITRFARSVVETQLIPDYEEFHRQLAAERRGFWKKAVDVTGKVLKIDASLWTPKFWGEMLEAVGVSLDTVDKRRVELSNKRQALQFMKSVDGSLVFRESSS